MYFIVKHRMFGQDAMLDVFKSSGKNTDCHMHMFSFDWIYDLWLRG